MVKSCLICASPFEPSKFNPHKAYCGNACKVAAHRLKNPSAEKDRRDREYMLRFGRPKLPRMAKCPRPPALPKMAPCPKPPKLCACGCVVPTHRRVCDPCADAKIKADRSKSRAVRRARHELHAEDFSPYEVFTRDRWKCCLCGVSTPRSLRGTFKDNAPELDHIVSLKEGGHHTRANTQCACRKCNIAKGSRSMGQLGLDWGVKFGGGLSAKIQPSIL